MGSFDFTGQVAVVTGAGRGLGRAYAIELARRGASVVVNDWGGGGPQAPVKVKDARGQRVVDEIVAAGGTAILSEADVATPEGGRAVIDAAVDAWGSVDIVINNAGFQRSSYFADETLEEIDAVLDVHLRGAFFVTQPAWRLMQRNGYGRVILTSSASGAFAHQGQPNYCAAKAGLIGLGRALAYEGRTAGINVNVVLPYADTPIERESPIPDLWQEFTRFVGQGTVELVAGRSDPARTAALVVYLVSRECDISGELYSTCLGRYARVFIGVAEGWLDSSDASASVEDVAAHIAEIRDTTSYEEPSCLYEEVAAIAQRLSAVA